MLKHEESLAGETAPPAAQVRVTPEELAAAITRIEARKDAAQRDVEGTVPIGEAVQQLGLDATPEEVLAEVQVERMRRSGTKTKRSSLRLRLGLTVAMAAMALGFVATFSMRTVPQSATISQNATRPAINTSPPMAVPPVAADNSPRHIQVDPIDPNHLQVGDASNKLVLMSEVGNNQIFRCPFYQVDLSFGDYSPGSPHSTWTLIKHGAKVYVRGWIPRVSDKLLQKDGVTVANLQSNTYVVPITIALDGFKASSNGFSDEDFNAQDIHLDKHAWEKW